MPCISLLAGLVAIGGYVIVFLDNKHLLKLGLPLLSLAFRLSLDSSLSGSAHDALCVTIVDADLLGGVHDFEAAVNQLNEFNFPLHVYPLVLAFGLGLFGHNLKPSN